MTLKKRMLSVIIALSVITVSLKWPVITADASYDGMLQFDENGKFTVMQLADIQENKEVEPGTIDLITGAIARYSPDLVVLTGDNIKGLISSNSFKAAVDQFLAPLIATNTKFAVTFGNHDDLGAWPVNPGSREEQYAYYKAKGGSLFVDHDVPGLDGTGSGSIPVYPFGQTSGAPAFQVFLMDSGAYINVTLDLDAVKTSQIDYYITTNPGVPSLWFQHIPVPELYNLFTQVPEGTANSFEGSHDPFNNYTWAMNTSLIDWKASGSTNIAEIYKEAPGPTNLSTYQEPAHRSSAAFGSKTLYEAWCSSGNMKGAFFGHNHMNTFVGTTTDGITLGYGKSATLEAYNDWDPGVRVFELDDSGSYTTISATRSSLTNYAAGDYTAVNNAFAAARVMQDGTTYFRANNINDPGYYNPASTIVGNGVYPPDYFIGDAVFLQKAIDSVEHNLDSRSQGLIDSFAASINAAWLNLNLKSADYSDTDRILSFDGGSTLLAPPFYSASHAGQNLPRHYFTEETINTWNTACGSVVPNLKIPDRSTVDGYALSLKNAYNALRLKPEFERGSIEPAAGAATVIDRENGFICGLVPGITQPGFESGFVTLYGNTRLSYANTTGNFGTGVKVDLIDNAANEVIQTYNLVIFGDVNGDGNIDSNDAGMITEVENYMIEWDALTDAAFYKAGDLNADGNIDSNDAGIVIDCENYRLGIDQTTGLVK